MPGKSARDKCFEEATDEYNKTLPEDKRIKIEHQKTWAVKPDGKWAPLSVVENIWNFIKTKGNPYRTPDWTLDIDGKPVAGDNKFEGDSYSPRKSPRSGNDQQTDQNQMNEDQNPGKREYQDLNLNPKDCKCKEDPEPERVTVPVMDPALMMNRGVFMVPLVNPATLGLGALGELGGAIAQGLGWAGRLAPAY
ncbi:MAG: hypothetical protein DMG11_17090 [Acidobacteria bacterium]|nr:MAG: hypothetical protein DMG11_17090 [Acidobacteriota bacterium]